MVPLAKKEKLYDMRSIPKLTDVEDSSDQLLIGAGAAPWTFKKRNGEVRVLFFFSSFFYRKGFLYVCMYVCMYLRRRR